MVNMNKINVVVGSGVVLAASVMVGCMNSRLAWDGSKELVTKPTGGVYAVTQPLLGTELEKPVLDLMKRHASERNVKFATTVDEKALPISVSVKQGTHRPTAGAIAAVNNVFSFCTLGIWPYVSSEETAYQVSVMGLFPCESGVVVPESIAYRDVVIGERSWSSFLVPFAAIPCPGWGDWRRGMSMNEEKGAFLEYRNTTLAADTMALLTDEVYRENLEKFKSQRTAMLARREKAVRLLQGSLSEKQKRMVESQEDLRPIILLDEKYFTLRDGLEGTRNIVMENVEDALGSLGVFRIISKQTVANNIKEKMLFSRLVGEGNADVMGKLEIPGYAVAVSVLQYGTKINQSTKRDYHKHAKESRRQIFEEKSAHVKLAVKITDLSSQDIIFSKTYEESAVTDKKKVGTVKQRYGNEEGKSFESDDSMLIPLVKKITEQAARDMIKEQVFHVIDCTDDGEITLDIASSLVKEGDTLDFFTRGKNVVSARSGMRKRKETRVGTLRVTEVTPSYCKACFATIEKLHDSEKWDVVVRIAK